MNILVNGIAYEPNSEIVYPVIKESKSENKIIVAFTGPEFGTLLYSDLHPEEVGLASGCYVPHNDTSTWTDYIFRPSK